MVNEQTNSWITEINAETSKKNNSANETDGTNDNRSELIEGAYNLPWSTPNQEIGVKLYQEKSEEGERKEYEIKTFGTKKVSFILPNIFVSAKKNNENKIDIKILNPFEKMIKEPIKKFIDSQLIESETNLLKPSIDYVEPKSLQTFMDEYLISQKEAEGLIKENKKENKEEAIFKVKEQIQKSPVDRLLNKRLINSEKITADLDRFVTRSEAQLMLAKVMILTDKNLLDWQKEFLLDNEERQFENEDSNENINIEEWHKAIKTQIDIKVENEQKNFADKPLTLKCMIENVCKILDDVESEKQESNVKLQMKEYIEKGEIQKVKLVDVKNPRTISSIHYFKIDGEVKKCTHGDVNLIEATYDSEKEIAKKAKAVLTNEEKIVLANDYEEMQIIVAEVMDVTSEIAPKEIVKEELAIFEAKEENFEVDNNEELSEIYEEEVVEREEINDKKDQLNEYEEQSIKVVEDIDEEVTATKQVEEVVVSETADIEEVKEATLEFTDVKAVEDNITEVMVEDTKVEQQSENALDTADPFTLLSKQFEELMKENDPSIFKDILEDYKDVFTSLEDKNLEVNDLIEPMVDSYDVIEEN